MFSKNRLILILGILVALMPFLGFPTSWKNFFYFVFGLGVATLSFLMARHKRIGKKIHHKKDKSVVFSKKEIVQSNYAEPIVEEEPVIEAEPIVEVEPIVEEFKENI